jgi:gluconate 2-dehydrogenase gamma chain
MADEPRIISRRDILRGVGIAGAAAVAAPATLLTTPDPVSAAEPAQAAQAARSVAREAFENLTAGEADLLEAMVDRLIPSDALGPGAREARAAHYIDRALGGALASSRQAYAAGLAALDRYAHASRGKGFLELSASDQDSVLMDVESGAATRGIFAGSSSQFFGLVLNHTRQGTFGDPYYGGNANFVGWDLLGYPGVRTMVTAADQKALEAGQLKANHKSAYDFDGFNKATARVDSPSHDGSDHRSVEHGAAGEEVAHGD